MSLSSAKSSLAASLNLAYQRAKTLGSADEANSDSIISILSQDISNAIHAYALQAQVSTVDTITPGQIDSPAAGATTSPGAGNGTGNLL